MGSVCLSSVAILRCESLDRVQVIALIIPTVFEAIFSTSLIVTMRGSREWVCFSVNVKFINHGNKCFSQAVFVACSRRICVFFACRRRNGVTFSSRRAGHCNPLQSFRPILRYVNRDTFFYLLTVVNFVEQPLLPFSLFSSTLCSCFSSPLPSLSYCCLRDCKPLQNLCYPPWSFSQFHQTRYHHSLEYHTVSPALYMSFLSYLLT